MKYIYCTFSIFMIGLSCLKAQQVELNQSVDQLYPTENIKAIEDSIQKDKQNGTIYSKVNKDGVIEITQKEFAKIPLQRQEILLKDKNYKIIEDK